MNDNRTSRNSNNNTARIVLMLINDTSISVCLGMEGVPTSLLRGRRMCSVYST